MERGVFVENPRRGDRARERFIAANLHLVASIARRFARQGLSSKIFLKKATLGCCGPSTCSTRVGDLSSQLTQHGGLSTR